MPVAFELTLTLNVTLFSTLSTSNDIGVLSFVGSMSVNSHFVEFLL